MAPQTDLDVLHLIGSLATGGAERNLYYLAPAMARSRMRYGVCCLFEPGEFAADVERAGVPVVALRYRQRSAPLAVVRLARILRKHRVRVLHTHLYQCGVIGRIAAWLAGVPVVVTHEHGKTIWKKWYHRWFERMAIHATDLRIAVSEDIRQLRITQEGTPADKIIVIGNAVDAASFPAGDARGETIRREMGLGQAFVVGAVGRLVEAKSYDLLVEVAGDVCGKRADARFLLVGDGPLRQSLARRRDALGLAEKFTLVGARADIPDILAAMDLYIITSQREGLPITLLEAMMAAKPIVATAAGGIPEVLEDGRDSLLVRPGNRRGLSEAVLALAGDPARRREMGERARSKAVARYSADAILETLEATYASLLKRKGLEAPGR
jgi:glycosyltransferase involved in cell wall biosynthesis